MASNISVDVLNIEGGKTGRTVELPQEVFGAEPNDHVIYLAVKQYLASHRQGTNKVKTRAEVQGASRKLHRQKGTGGARKGNIRNPLYKGGGTIFGPKPRDYTFKLNRKVKDLAKISALSHKAKSGSLLVVEELNFAQPKTKQFFDIPTKLKVSDKKALRNIPNAASTLLSDINTYDIVNADVLVLTESAAKIFLEEENAVV